MSEFGGMSIQERIRAMNKTIDKVGALPANVVESTIPVSTTGAAASNKHFEERHHEYEEDEHDPVVQDEYAEQGPRRTSVVDMWRKREVSSPEANKPSPGPRKKSVLEKWSTAQQRSVAQEKVAEVAVSQEEKKENESPPKLSVAEMIAQKSMQHHNHPATVASPMVAKSSAPTTPQPKLSIADMIAQRASTLGSAPPSAARKTTPGAFTPVKRTPLVSKEKKTPPPPEEDESHHSAPHDRDIELRGSTTSEEVEADVVDVSEAVTATPTTSQRQSVSDIWKSRMAPTTQTPVKKSDSKVATSSPLVETKLKPMAARNATQPGSKFSSPSPAKDTKPAWARTVLKSTDSPATTLSSPPASVKPSWKTSESPIASRSAIEPRSMDSKPSWARKPLVDSSSVDDANAADTKTEPEMAAVFSPTKTSTSGLKSVDSKPSWARKSAFTPQSPVVPSKPFVVSSPVTKKETTPWAKKAPLTPVPGTFSPQPTSKPLNRTATAAASPSSHASPSMAAKPAWTVSSLRKTGLRVGTDDDQTVQSAPAVSTSITAVKQSKWNKTGASTKHGDLSNELVKKFESLSMDMTSPKRRNPNRIKVDIDMSSKACVDSDVVLEEDPAAEHEQEVVMQESGVATSEGNAGADVAPPTVSSHRLSSGSKNVHDPSIVDWPADSEPEELVVETKMNTSPVQKQDKVKSPALRYKPVPSAKSPFTPLAGIDKAKSQPARATSPLIELAMQYRQSPSRDNSSANNANGIRASPSSESAKQGNITSATRLAMKNRSSIKPASVVSKNTTVSNTVTTATPPRVVRRRNRVAQKHLNNKHIQSVSSNASSDVESVADSKKENETPISTEAYNKSTSEDDDEPGRIIPKSPVLSPTRLSVNKESDTLSPNSSRLSRPEEKKEIQKRRNRMKGKDDDRSVFSTDSQSVVSQGSSFIAPSNFLAPLLQDPITKSVDPMLEMNSKAQYSSTTHASNDAVGRTLTISKMSGYDDEISKVTEDENTQSKISPEEGYIKTAESADHNYIPDALSPRSFKANLSNRMRHKKGQRAAAQGTKSEVGVSDTWGFLTAGDDNRSAISSTSGSSALAERATKVLQRRRGGKLGESPKPQLEVKVESPVFPFPASDALVAREHSGLESHSRAIASTPEQTRPSSTKSTSGKTAKKTKRSTVDRSGFVNRYKSSERFMDSTGNDSQTGLTPRLAQDQSLQNFSYASEISTTSSPVAAYSDDGSDPYIKRRSASMKSESTVGPLGIDQNFRHQSASNMFAMQNAYKSVTATDLAFDLKEELAGTLTGSFEAMKNLASEFGKLTGAPQNNCQAVSCKRGYKPSRTPMESCRSDEEDVAIEVEYIGDDEFPMDEEEFFDKQAQERAVNHRVPAGQSSSEFYM